MALSQQSKWGSIIAALAFTFIAVATLTPGTPVSAADAADVCRGWCDDSLVADFLRNIVLFMPFGFGLRLIGVRNWKVIVVGSTLSATIEILQIRIIVGRDASALDWISNTAGTAAGVMVAAHLRTLLLPRPFIAARLAATALVAWIGLLILGAWGIQPAPTDRPFWGQRTPQLGESTPFRGDLISGRVDDAELPSGRMANPGTLRSSMHAGGLTVDAVVTVSPTSSPISVSPIVRVADGARREILMLGRGGKELVFRYRLRATTLRLETPAFALASAFHDDPAGSDAASPPESLAVAVTRGSVELSARGDGVHRVRRFTLSPAIAWSFLLPWDYWFGPNADIIERIWLAALLLPVGYWTTMLTRQNRSITPALLVAVIVAITLPIVRYAFGLQPTPVSEWAAAGVGLAAGWSLALAALRRKPHTSQPEFSARKTA